MYGFMIARGTVGLSMGKMNAMGTVHRLYSRTVHRLSFVQYLGFYVQSSFPQGAEFSTSFPQVFHRAGKNCVHFSILRTVAKNRGRVQPCTIARNRTCTVVITYLTEKRFFDVKSWTRTEMAYYDIFLWVCLGVF